MFGIIISSDNKPKRTAKGNNLIDLPESFVVTDVETTGLDPEWDNIIEISAIKIMNSKITDTYTSLIHQDVCLDEYYPDIVELTGITQSMLNAAPNEETVMRGFNGFVENNVIIGHNVNFDINFIYDTLQKYNIDFKNDFIDTMRFARRLLPELKHHRLIDIADYFNIDTAGNHRALKDCEITLDCYNNLKTLALNKYKDIDSFRSTWNHKSPVHAKDITASTTDFDETHPLYNKVCVFTGTLSISRKDAMQLVVDVGGQIADGVTKKTNFLVLGNNDYCSTIKDGKSTKQKKAEKLKAAGQDIEVISENVFFDMLNN